jgi:hypothetical protein
MLYRRYQFPIALATDLIAQPLVRVIPLKRRPIRRSGAAGAALACHGAADLRERRNQGLYRML